MGPPYTRGIRITLRTFLPSFAPRLFDNNIYDDRVFELCPEGGGGHLGIPKVFRVISLSKRGGRFFFYFDVSLLE